MDRESPNTRHQKSEEWNPQRIDLSSRINSKRGKRTGRPKREENNQGTMFESFTNMDDVMAMAIQKSLNSAEPDEPKHQTMAESFRNLDCAMAQAQKNSLSDDYECGKGDKKTFHESFVDLDDATALAIKKSLESEQDKSLFESFANLDGAMSEALKNSLNLDDNSDDSMFESFVNLDEAMAQALKNSLNEGNDEVEDCAFGGGKYEYLERLEEDGSEDDSEISDSIQSGNSTGKGLKSSFTSVNNSRVEFVAEPAPNLSRLARRHADRRLRKDKIRASLNFDGAEEDGDSGANVEQPGGGRRNSAPPRPLTRDSSGASERRRAMRKPSSADGSNNIINTNNDRLTDLHYSSGQSTSDFMKDVPCQTRRKKKTSMFGRNSFGRTSKTEKSIEEKS